MAVRIVKRTYTSFACGEIVDIIADTEADISALGKIVKDGYDEVDVGPGSVAYTADMSVIYQMSPSGTWAKVKG